MHAAERHTVKRTPVLWARGESRQSLYLHPSRPYCRHKETWKTTKMLDGRHQRLDRTTSGWVRENCTEQKSMACKGVAGFSLRSSGMRKNQSSPVSIDWLWPLNFWPCTCRNVFAIITADLANLTFEHHIPSSSLALSRHCLRTELPDCTEPSNYRPVTNLNSISKILERLVLDRLVSHVTSSTRFDPMLSAYRRFYSTDTVLLKITSDIYQAFDHTRQSTVLVALDQSAAFDYVDHSTLLTQLHSTFGVTVFFLFIAEHDRMVFYHRCCFQFILMIY